MKRQTIAAAASALVLALLVACAATVQHDGKSSGAYPLHASIRATVFWVGEPSDADNKYIPNQASAWDGQWQSHFGGVDDPKNRQHDGFWPMGFQPQENPFYFALPYSEYDNASKVKTDATRVPWYNPAHPPTSSKSIIKNRWVAVTYKGKTVYAQWEDSGPLYDDDAAYVFGPADATPKYSKSGIDLSPATASYLGFPGGGRVSWQFVDSPPQGPWTEIVTTQQVSW